MRERETERERERKKKKIYIYIYTYVLRANSGEFSGIQWGFVWHLVWIQWEFLGDFGATPHFREIIGVWGGFG